MSTPSASNSTELLGEVGERLAFYLAVCTQRHPKAWREIADIRESRSDHSQFWPEWCWLPAAALEPLFTSESVPAPDDPVALFIDDHKAIMRLNTLAQWRLGKVVLRFHDELAAALDDTDGIDTVPTSTLYRLPAWCVYVIDDLHDPFLGHIRGWFAHLDYDADSHRPVLALLLDIEDPEDGVRTCQLPVPLDDSTIADALREVLANTIRLGIKIQWDEGAVPQPLCEDQADDLAKIAKRCIARLLYVCSDEPDLVQPASPGATLSPAERGSPRKPWTAASQIARWDVGYRVGADIHDLRTRCESATGTGRKVRPHWRKAHWHKYWTGPNRSVLVLRWIQPVLVGVSNLDDLPVVERGCYEASSHDDLRNRPQSSS